MTDFLAAFSPGRPRRSIKPLNTCRMAVGNVFQADLQPWAAVTPIGILKVNHIPPGNCYVLLYSLEVTHMKKTSAPIMMIAAASGPSANDALDDELLSAARAGDSALVENLLDRGADIEARDNNHGYTALMLASFNGQAAVVETLLNRGAHINARNDIGETALDIAYYKGHREVISALRTAGAVR